MKGNITTQIPSELTSVAIDGVVASSEAIFDYIQNKTQEELNEMFCNMKLNIDSELKVTKTIDQDDIIFTFS